MALLSKTFIILKSFLAFCAFAVSQQPSYFLYLNNPETLKEATYNFIISNHNGINKNTLVENLKKYRHFADDTVKENINLKVSDKELIDEYLDLCRFHPVTFGEGSAANPEEGKIKALRSFINYCKDLAQEIGKKAMFKNDVENHEIITFIGF